MENIKNFIIDYIEWKYSPQITTILVSFGFFLCHKNLPLINELIIKVAGMVISINVSILGFLLTILALINGLKSKAMGNLNLEGKRNVLNYLKNTVNWNLFTLIPSGIILFIDSGKSSTTLLNFLSYSNINLSIGYLYLVLMLNSIFVTSRFAYLFTLLISEPNDENELQ